MTRTQRRAHLLAWILLTPLIATALVVALVNRVRIPVQEAPAPGPETPR